MKAQNDVRVTIRVDKDLKDRADRLFNRLGMNMTTALNVFLNKAVDEEAIPFAIGAKNALFAGGYTAADITKAFSSVVHEELSGYKRNGHPIAGYDSAKKCAFLEYADGTREYVNEQ